MLYIVCLDKIGILVAIVFEKLVVYFDFFGTIDKTEYATIQKEIRSF